MPKSHDIKNFMRQVRKRQDERLSNQLATHDKAGVMSAADKIKLDMIQFDFERGTLSVVTDTVTLTFAAIKE